MFLPPHVLLIPPSHPSNPVHCNLLASSGSRPWPVHSLWSQWLCALCTRSDPSDSVPCALALIPVTLCPVYSDPSDSVPCALALIPVTLCPVHSDPSDSVPCALWSQWLCALCALIPVTLCPVYSDPSDSVPCALALIPVTLCPGLCTLIPVTALFSLAAW
jgi:hypothetical protein